MKYILLDEIEHVRTRPTMYAGSIDPKTTTEYTYNQNQIQQTEITYIPALVKIFSEILDNAIDEHKRTPLTQIKVSVSPTTITIEDNGKGIPVELHPKTNQYIAETIFSNLRAGSNFNDNHDQSLIGTNGLGSTLTAILSSSFIIESADNSLKFYQEYTSGLTQKSIPKITKSNKSFTKITFQPDLNFFKIPYINQDHILKFQKKVLDAAATNTNVNFFFNSIPIKIKSFSDYVNLYNSNSFEDNNPDWNVSISKSNQGFTHISFVNSVETYNGGTHVDYVTNQITAKLKDEIKKKFKIDVKPSDIKNHIAIFISANINRPKFSSQTKENLVSPPQDWKTSWNPSPKFIKKILNSDIIQSTIDYINLKDQANTLASLRKLNKPQQTTKKIENFHDATSKDRSNCSLFIVEGLSALSGLISGRGNNTKTVGLFSLKGKPINVHPMSLKDIIANEEFKNLMSITGLQIGEKPINLRFNKIIFATDSDKDGYSIRGLLINAFYKFWPELFINSIFILNTPIIKTTHKNKVYSFYNEEDFINWCNNHNNFTVKRYKGLGTSSSQEWKEYFLDIENNLDKIILDQNSQNIINLQFSKEKGMTDKRKEWLKIEE